MWTALRRACVTGSIPRAAWPVPHGVRRQTRMGIVLAGSGEAMISADEPEHSDALPRYVRLDRTKRLELAAQGLQGQVEALKKENGEKATRVTTLAAACVVR